MLVCCSKRLMIAWVALTRSGLSSAVQNVRLLLLSFLPPPPPQPTAMSRSTASRATRIVRVLMAAPRWLATLGTCLAATLRRFILARTFCLMAMACIRPSQRPCTCLSGLKVKLDRKRHHDSWPDHDRGDARASEGP